MRQKSFNQSHPLQKKPIQSNNLGKQKKRKIKRIKSLKKIKEVTSPSNSKKATELLRKEMTTKDTDPNKLKGMIEPIILKIKDNLGNKNI